MASAAALSVPARLTLQLSGWHVLDRLGLRTAVAVSVLATLSVAGAASALLLPEAPAPAHTTVSPTPTAITQSR